jgi:hypothetical protein
MTERQPAGMLHNMSAPPRTRIVLQPLGPPAAHPTARMFARVCLHGLLWNGRSDRAAARDIRQGLIKGVPIDLVETVAALRCRRIRPGYQRTVAYGAALRTVEAMPLDAVHDELLERLAMIDASPLPPVLLAREIDVRLAAPPCLAPMLALRLLAGTTGGLFIRDRRPGTGPFLSLAAGGPAVPYQFDYWRPVLPDDSLRWSAR